MRHHYVPQFLQRAFSFDNGERICVFDKRDMRQFETTTRRMLQKPNFYAFPDSQDSESYERRIATLESKASRVLQKIIANRSTTVLSQEEQITIATFSVIQFARVPNFRDLARLIDEQTIRELQDAGYFIPEDELDDSFVTDHIQEMSLLFFDVWVDKIASYVLQHHWIVLAAPASTHFYLGDNPVTLRKDHGAESDGTVGFDAEGVEIYFPITPHLCLGWISDEVYEQTCAGHEALAEEAQKLLLEMKFSPRVWPPFQKRAMQELEQQLEESSSFLTALQAGTLVRCPREMVDTINALQVAWSDRFVLSSCKDFGFAIELIQKHPELRRAYYDRVKATGHFN